MAIYAYEDANRTKKIAAIDALTMDRNKRYYCSNPNCDAHLFVCVVNGSKEAYFRATKKAFNHIDNCKYTVSGKLNLNEYNEELFDFDKIMVSFFSISNKKNTTLSSNASIEVFNSKNNILKPLKTLRQLYLMCLEKNPKDKYAGREIGEMLLDERSFYRYPNGCYGYRIVEAYADRRVYANSKREIYLLGPIKNKKYSFVLHFSDWKIYNTIRNEIYNNKSRTIVVAGDWKSSKSYNSYTTEISNLKQVCVIK